MILDGRLMKEICREAGAGQKEPDAGHYLMVEAAFGTHLLVEMHPTQLILNHAHLQWNICCIKAKSFGDHLIDLWYNCWDFQPYGTVCKKNLAFRGHKII